MYTYVKQNEFFLSEVTASQKRYKPLQCLIIRGSHYTSLTDDAIRRIK